MSLNFKRFSILSALAVGLITIPVTANAEIQCPTGWVKELHGVAEVCVAQNQNQTQAQVQNNNQNQNINQNVNATGGSSSSSSSSSSESNITFNNPTPQVVYQAQARVAELPRTGLPETALALSALLPAGFALKKFRFKKSETIEESASSIWLKKQSSH